MSKTVPQLDDCPAENEGDFSDSDSGEASEEGSPPTTLVSESWGSTVGSNWSKQLRQFHTEWLRQLAEIQSRTPRHAVYYVNKLMQAMLTANWLTTERSPTP